MTCDQSINFYYDICTDPEGTEKPIYDFCMSLITQKYLTWQQYLVEAKFIDKMYDLREFIFNKTIKMEDYLSLPRFVKKDIFPSLTQLFLEQKTTLESIYFFIKDEQLCETPHAKDKIQTFLLGDVAKLIQEGPLTRMDVSTLYDTPSPNDPDTFPFQSIPVWKLIANHIFTIEDAELLTQEDLLLLKDPQRDLFEVMYDLSIMKGNGLQF